MRDRQTNRNLLKLSANILPVSGTQACTAAAIEIESHKEAKYEADIYFITEDAFRMEINILLGELQDCRGSADTGSSILAKVCN